MLLLMLSKCPRYFNHGPAIEIWSVVHLPFALINNFKPFKSVPSQVQMEQAIASGQMWRLLLLLHRCHLQTEQQSLHLLPQNLLPVVHHR
jgi:hypothetical protein